MIIHIEDVTLENSQLFIDAQLIWKISGFLTVTREIELTFCITDNNIILESPIFNKDDESLGYVLDRYLDDIARKNLIDNNYITQFYELNKSEIYENRFTKNFPNGIPAVLPDIKTSVLISIRDWN